MPKISDEKKRARREEILDAAAACFSEIGFAETKMRHIFDQSGLSAGAVYSYFENKEAIVVALCTERTEKYVHYLEKQLQTSDDAVTVMTDIVTSYATGLNDEDVLEQARVKTQMWGVGLSRPEFRAEMQANFDTFTNTLADTIRIAQKSGDLNPDLDPQMIAEVIMTFTFALDLRKSFEPGFDVNGFATVVKSMIQGSFHRGSQ